MLLVVDAGNTNVVFAVHDGNQWRGTWRVKTEAQRTSDEYAVWLLALFGLVGLKPADISEAVIGTVVPAALYHLRRCCRDWFSVEPLVARSTLDWGFEIKVDRPPEVGADRLLNALAGHQRFGGPLIVVDFGTATTKGPGKTKKNTVNNPVAAATKDSDAGRGSSAATGASKYITLTTRM